jgi:hypothetical protein
MTSLQLFVFLAWAGSIARASKDVKSIPSITARVKLKYIDGVPGISKFDSDLCLLHNSMLCLDPHYLAINSQERVNISDKR